MLDHEPRAPETVAREETELGRLGARERAQARAAAVALVHPELERFARGTSPAAEAVGILLDAYHIDSNAATNWREAYYALQGRLIELAASNGAAAVLTEAGS